MSRAVTRPSFTESSPSPARRFVLRFLLAFGAFEVLIYLVLWRASVFTPYAELNARAAAALLAPWIEGAAASADNLIAPQFGIHVLPGCDSYQASAVLLAGIVAFPARLGRKLIGAALGVALLALLNLGRLGTLLWAGVHRRELFDALHQEVLPGVFLFAALFLWIGWALWARRDEAHAA